MFPPYIEITPPGMADTRVRDTVIHPFATCAIITKEYQSLAMMFYKRCL